MIALVKFSSVVGGKEKTFLPGDKISADEATEMDLKNKPKLAKKSK